MCLECIHVLYVQYSTYPENNPLQPIQLDRHKSIHLYSSHHSYKMDCKWLQEDKEQFNCCTSVQYVRVVHMWAFLCQ